MDNITGCNGVGCAYNLAGMGFSFDCESVDRSNNFVNTASITSNQSDLTLFAVNVSMLYPDQTKNYSRFELTMTYPSVSMSESEDDTSCPTNFTTTTCEIRPAVLNYTTWYIQTNNVEGSRLEAVLNTDAIQGTNKYAEANRADKRNSVSISESGSTLGASCGSIPANIAGDEASSNEVGECWGYNYTVRQMLGVPVLKNIDLYEPFVPGANSSLLGLYQTLKDILESQATISYHNGRWYETTTGHVATVHGTPPTVDGSCAYTFVDPTLDAILRINQLTRTLSVYRTAYGEAASSPPNTNVICIQYFSDIYHTTDYSYAIAAMICTFVVVVILVLPVYWKFWQLGRNVTLGPLEIAYAFQGPAFAGVTDTNGHVSDLVRTAGDTRIKYVEVQDEAGTKLAFKTT